MIDMYSLNEICYRMVNEFEDKEEWGHVYDPPFIWNTASEIMNRVWDERVSGVTYQLFDEDEYDDFHKPMREIVCGYIVDLLGENWDYLEDTTAKTITFYDTNLI